MTAPRLRTRFAPSPTGLLHVGNAYSALLCQQWAISHDADLLLRIEDIDHTRCRSVFSDHIKQDMAWLGIQTPPPRIQSQHIAYYQKGLERLRNMDVMYPCFCTRKQIHTEIERMGIAPHHEDDHAVYPGTCRQMDEKQRAINMRKQDFAWRLDIRKALIKVGRNLFWQDDEGTSHPASICSDVIIGRKDIGISYHLAVVMDDAEQDITHIIRGEDLRGNTGIHRLLQALLELPSPIYIHHPMLCDTQGRHLSKRHHAFSLSQLREAGIAPEYLRQYLLCSHLSDHHQPEFRGVVADI